MIKKILIFIRLKIINMMMGKTELLDFKIVNPNC
jgi:hypothetical protein